ncbi:hypothetical protein [Micromonospora sp. NBC_01796]|uniref:hypothetical protein n=1 Tax=Micromonospora sp. NBC_01796 TaxID=2975987 RepID=UPI002DDC67C0|nr:hypothetical protein [Micromonospora sp. NBC_01796]WSA88699.1 hypothetical protein OIE47_14455 [Micromonospora sp. NBC_01796]
MRDGRAGPTFQTAGRTVWQALAVAAILWSIVDERVTISFGLAFFYVVVGSAASDLVAMGAWSTGSWALVDLGVLAILPVLSIAVGATVAVFRARV